jgi:hypothetical protein
MTNCFLTLLAILALSSCNNTENQSGKKGSPCQGIDSIKVDEINIFGFTKKDVELIVVNQIYNNKVVDSFFVIPKNDKPGNPESVSFSFNMPKPLHLSSSYLFKLKTKRIIRLEKIRTEMIVDGVFNSNLSCQVVQYRVDQKIYRMSNIILSKEPLPEPMMEEGM